MCVVRLQEGLSVCLTQTPNLSLRLIEATFYKPVTASPTGTDVDMCFTQTVCHRYKPGPINDNMLQYANVFK